jgi:hypothetical protein
MTLLFETRESIQPEGRVWGGSCRAGWPRRPSSTIGRGLPGAVVAIYWTMRQLLYLPQTSAIISTMPTSTSDFAQGAHMSASTNTGSTMLPFGTSRRFHGVRLYSLMRMGQRSVLRSPPQLVLRQPKKLWRIGWPQAEQLLRFCGHNRDKPRLALARLLSSKIGRSRPKPVVSPRFVVRVTAASDTM